MYFILIKFYLFPKQSCGYQLFLLAKFFFSYHSEVFLRKQLKKFHFTILCMHLHLIIWGTIVSHIIGGIIKLFPASRVTKTVH